MSITRSKYGMIIIQNLTIQIYEIKIKVIICNKDFKKSCQNSVLILIKTIFPLFLNCIIARNIFYVHHLKEDLITII